MAEEATSLDALMKMITLFAGSGKQTQTSSGGTATQKSEVSAEGLQAILKQALESNQGLASVMSGEKSAGLYNSSTNSLLSNDLVSRLTAQAAANSKTVTTTTPQTFQTTQTKSPLAGQTGKLAGGVAAGTLLQNLLKTGSAGVKIATDKGAQNLVSKGYDAVSDFVGNIGSVNGADAMSALNTAALPNSFPGTSMSGEENVINQFLPQQSTAPAGMADTINALLGNGGDAASTAGNIADTIGSAVNNSDLTQAATPAVDAAENLVSSGAAEESVGGSANFSQTSATGSLNSGSNSAVSAVSGVDSAASSVVQDELTRNIGNSAAELSPDYTSAFGPANSDIFSAGSTSELGSVANGSFSTAESLGSDTALITEGLGGAAGSGAAATDILGGAGSSLGYLGSLYMAANAPKNPKGAQNTDYRQAVGSAVLNYLGYGWATPIVDAVARPALDAAGDAGYKAMGNAGIVASDPVGALVSGRLDFGDVVTSGLDPGNIFGGNEGGSVGGFIGATVDPVGTALGGEGLAGVVSDATNSIDSALSPGRVVCTELALAGYISAEKYREVIKPDVTLTGRILLGYHVLGVPAVRRLRSNPKFALKALPYVNAYLDHKLGKWNLTGWLIKSIGEPLCWVLSFFNSDPEYYKVLYPYRRTRDTVVERK